MRRGFDSGTTDHATSDGGAARGAGPRRRGVSMLVAGAVALALPLVAVAGEGRRGPRDEGGDAAGGRGDPAAREAFHAKMKARFAELIRKDVGLSEDKAKQIEAIFARQHADAKGQREAVRGHREALRALLQADSDDQAAYQKALDGLQAAHEELQAQRKRGLLAARKVLTPKEQAKFLRAMHQARRHMMHRRFGPGGPGGPGGRGGRGGPGGDHAGEPHGGPEGEDELGPEDDG